MNDKNPTRLILYQVGKTLFFLLGILLYLNLLGMAAGYFYAGDCLLFGAEQIVGARNVQYDEDGSFYYTNPGAMILRRGLYLLCFGALTWTLAVVGEWWRSRLCRSSVRGSKNRWRLLFANLFAVIFIAIGMGILSWAARRDAELWADVRSFTTVAQYENRFGPAAYHFPQIGAGELEWVAQNGRLRDREFALGKELYGFGSAWPFRWFLVWLEHGTIVKTTWRGL